MIIVKAIITVEITANQNIPNATLLLLSDSFQNLNHCKERMVKKPTCPE